LARGARKDYPKKEVDDFAARSGGEKGDVAAAKDEERCGNWWADCSRSTAATLRRWRQFSQLFVWSLRLSSREKLSVVFHAVQTLVMGSLIGGVYYQLPLTQPAISQRRARLFFRVFSQGVFRAMMTSTCFLPSDW
jgi:hypothetical protein